MMDSTPPHDLSVLEGDSPGTTNHAPPAVPPLETLRAEVERVDRELVRLIAERVEIARRIGQLKRQNGSLTLDPAREAAVVRTNAELARTHALPAEDVREIFWRIIALCRRAQAEAP